MDCSPAVAFLWKMAAKEARDRGAVTIDPVCFLVAICKAVDGNANLSEIAAVRSRFVAARIDAKRLRRRFRSLIISTAAKPSPPQRLHRSSATREAFRQAEERAAIAGRETVTVSDLLSSILHQDDRPWQGIFAEIGIADPVGIFSGDRLSNADVRAISQIQAWIATANPHNGNSDITKTVAIERTLQQYPGVDMAQVLHQAIVKPVTKKRLLRVLQAGGEEALKFLFAHLPLAVPLEMIKAWIEEDN